MSEVLKIYLSSETRSAALLENKATIEGKICSAKLFIFILQNRREEGQFIQIQQLSKINFNLVDTL